MGERRGTKALELWCRRVTEGYPGVKVDNMTTSWRDGLAFCALIHHFRPDLIDFSSLKKGDVYHNNELAFRTAEAYLGIPALLDAEDMAQYAVPDRLSILTYLSQYYQHFASTESPNRITVKRAATSTEHNSSPGSSAPPTKMRSSLGRKEPCVKCSQPVFLAQRLIVDKQFFHRTCFKCFHCGTQLTLASYKHTEPEGLYTCEICPDQDETDSLGEETNSDAISNQEVSSYDNISMSEYNNQVLSDEEKVRQLLAKRPSVDEAYLAAKAIESSKALSGFMLGQFDEDEAPALPLSPPPVVVRSKLNPSEHVSSETCNKDSSNISDSDAMNKVLGLKEQSVRDVSDSSPVPTPRKRDDSRNIFIAKDNSDASDTVASQRTSLVKSRLKIFETENSKNNDVFDHNTRTILSSSNLKENSNSLDANDESQIVNVEANVPYVVETRKEETRSDEQDDESILLVVDNNSNTDNNDKDATSTAISDSDSHINVVEFTNHKDNDQVDIRKDEEVIGKDSEHEAHENKDTGQMVDEESCRQKDKSKLQEELQENSGSHNDLNDFDENNVKDANGTNGDHNMNDDNCVDEDINGPNVKDNAGHGNEENINPKTAQTNKDNIDTEIISNIDENSINQRVKEDVEHIAEGNSSCKNEESINDNNGDEDDISQIDEKKDVEDNISQKGRDDSKSIANDEIDVNIENSHKEKVEEKTEHKIEDDKKDVNAVEEIKPTADVSSKSNHEYPEELNPFGSDDEKEESETVANVSTSLNPFGSCSEDEEESLPVVEKKKSEKPPRPPPPTILVQPSKGLDGKKKIIPAPSLNPFGSDDETDEEDLKTNISVPTPSNRLSEGPPSFHGSVSSLVGTHRRKKAPAPRPPTTQQVFAPLIQHTPPSSSTLPSPPHSIGSPQASPRSRKRRPAPPPPPVTSSPLPHYLAPSPHHHHDSFHRDNSCNSSIGSQHKRVISAAEFDEQDLEITSSGEWNGAIADSGTKEAKDSDMNELMFSSLRSNPEKGALDTSTASRGGRHHRKKGPAPSIPLIGRGAPMSAGALRREMAMLEEQQRGLERQGVRLETLIRERTEGPEGQKEGGAPAVDLETDELLLQLFDIVNEKNELFRRQAELMYLRKQQRLEEEQADLEQQVRVLMQVEESNKTDAEKQREEALLERLVGVIERRDRVVEALDQERLRERAEDTAIRERMTLHRAKLEELSSEPKVSEKKEKKKKHWIKKGKVKKKDTDETSEENTSGSVQSDTKKQNKHKKWFK